MDSVSGLPPWLLAADAFLLLTTVVTFFVNAGQRARIANALRSAPSGQPLGLFDLARGNVGDKLRQKDFVVPEQLWTYDADYMERFAKAAERAQLADRQTALTFYAGPVLRWDIAFAVAFGLFIAVSEFAGAALVSTPLLGGALVFCGSMGLVYGAADVAEDFKLIAILTDWRALVRARADAVNHEAADLPIDGGEAAAANALTRIKVVTNVLSILGIAIFLILTGVAAVVFRTPGNPRPAPADEGGSAIAPG